MGECHHPDSRALARMGLKVRARLAQEAHFERIDVPAIEIWHGRDFVAPATCARLMAMIDAVACPSLLVEEEGWDDYRTSYSGDINPHDRDVRALNRQLDHCLGIEPEWGENLQGQRYRTGEYFHEHYDWFDTQADYWQHERRAGGQRSWTAMLYLNSVDEGGETHFPTLGLRFLPRPGTVLIWNNALPDGTPNPATLHAARPVKQGEKYILTKWYRARPCGEAA